MPSTTRHTSLLLIISGPSGVGKTTIARAVEKRFDGVLSVSMTTRPMAVRDREGVDYFFVGKERFEALREAGQFLESAQVFDNHYGTPRQPVIDALVADRLMIVEIDLQGAAQVKANMPDAFAIFILPPSESALLERLRGRNRDDEATIHRRFAEARTEIAQAKGGDVYDAFIVNEDLKQAIGEAIGLVEQRLARGQMRNQ